jgi:type IV pilus assembly protein PilC
MSSYSYTAVDPQGSVSRGTLDVADQSEALQRIREMGLFPTKVIENPKRKELRMPTGRKPGRLRKRLQLTIPIFSGRVRTSTLTVFTRQLATLVEAGMPLVRSLRTLQEQEENRAMKRVLEDLASSIESGNSLAEAVAQHPKVFNGLYVNMVKAGEIGGALETTLTRLAEYMEKARKIKGKVKAALYYPAAVLFIATGIVMLLMTYVVPRFKAVFEGVLDGRQLPAFTLFVFNLSQSLRSHFITIATCAGGLVLLLGFALRTRVGRRIFDRLKLSMPLLGPLFRKASISRFSRTLGTLVSSGVPILQALTIVKETAGNLIIGNILSNVRENVKQGEPIAPTLKRSSLFPPMVAGMVDVGEQTGALPEMLMKIADNYDDEVDNTVSALTSLLEPVMIVFLAVVVGGIVIAVFLPIIQVGPLQSGDEN